MGYGHGGKQPRLAEVLNALAADASSVDNTNGFEDFASELGYEADSRKAERIYRVCVRQAGKFKNFIGETLYDLLLWDTDQD